MTAKPYNFRGTPPAPDDCRLPPPTFDCVPCEPCNPCETRCPPKVRAKDALCLSDEEWERCFSLRRWVGCERLRIPAFVTCMLLKVRKQGFCRVLTEECPVRSDAQGNVCFVWSDKFRALPAGYYEADLHINGEVCLTLLFHKKSCWTSLRTESVELDKLPCDTPCCDVGCVPYPDIESPEPMGDCNADKCK